MYMHVFINLCIMYTFYIHVLSLGTQKSEIKNRSFI